MKTSIRPSTCLLSFILFAVTLLAWSAYAGDESGKVRKWESGTPSILTEIPDAPLNVERSTLNVQPSETERYDGKVDEKEASPYAAGAFTLSPFASYRAHQTRRFDGRFGAGLAVSYAPVDNIAIEAETLGERYTDDPLVDSLTEAGVNLKGYLPIGDSGLAGYGFIGYTRNLQIDENRMNAGAGLEVRGKVVYAFADGRWTHDFATPGHALFRVGIGAHF